MSDRSDFSSFYLWSMILMVLYIGFVQGKRIEKLEQRIKVLELLQKSNSTRSIQ